MPLHSYLVLFAFTLLGVVFIVRVIALRGEGSEILGKPSIDKYYFFSGKIALFTTWALFIVKAIVPKLGYIHVPPALCWTATGLLWIGSALFSIALVGLGKSLKVGLPSGETTLQTGGIYRFSRNPIYTAVSLIAFASCLYFPDLINVSFAIYGMYIHHQIIKGEELFLARRFGKDWENYCLHVRRYV